MRCVFFFFLNEQVVSGIAFPLGSDKLYTGSTDEPVRVWDCQSGKVVTVFFNVMLLDYLSLEKVIDLDFVCQCSYAGYSCGQSRW